MSSQLLGDVRKRDLFVTVLTGKLTAGDARWYVEGDNHIERTRVLRDSLATGRSSREGRS
jgi:hypothetical protein